MGIIKSYEWHRSVFASSTRLNPPNSAVGADLVKNSNLGFCDSKLDSSGVNKTDHDYFWKSKFFDLLKSQE